MAKKVKDDQGKTKIKLTEEEEGVVEQTIDAAFEYGKEIVVNGLGSIFALSEKKAEIKRQKVKLATSNVKKLAKSKMDSLWNKFWDTIWPDDDS